MYRSPKYWKEMARARKEHEARMKREAKPQASSAKHQAVDMKEIIGYKIVNKGEINI